ncbi:MAG: hypothetical protein CMQ60_04120 [Gammaproteobacteria bacterium]|nr:hypothetical protein [Gammaproteobacteria bacterium]|tara:strand:- start:4692 stop:5441 length:750 start_codon:yes stop_codon:yes gene_type:complete
MNNYYVFDFDGVVCDSTNECLVCSSNAMQKLEGNSNFKYYLSDFSEELIHSFSALRPFVKGGSQYYTLYQILRSKMNLETITQNVFDEVHKTFLVESETYKPHFYKARNELQEFNFSNWLDLHTVYEWVIDFLRENLDRERLMIATLKDKDSVMKILKHYDLEIDPDLVVDQFEIKTKLEALNRIIESKKILKEEIVFIDDNIAHLLGPKNAGFNCFLAAWSNVSESSIKLANEQNIDILEDLKKFTDT